MTAEERERLARDNGIDTQEVVRAGLIELRNAMLSIDRFHEAVLLSHAIWWLAPEPDAAVPP